VLAPLKTNIGPKPPALSYRLEEAPNGVVRVVWEAGECGLTTAQLLAAPTDDEQRSQVNEACRVMTELLSDGPVPAGPGDALKRRIAEEAGVSLRTVDTAKAKLGVISRKEGLGAGWVWMLPAGRWQAYPQDRQAAGVTTFAPPLRSSHEAAPAQRALQPAFEEVL